ncbi:MAG: hypothetical protein FD152_3711, partial [Xanthobacteraceae bacterium]
MGATNRQEPWGGLAVERHEDPAFELLARHVAAGGAVVPSWDGQRPTYGLGGEYVGQQSLAPVEVDGETRGEGVWARGGLPVQALRRTQGEGTRERGDAAEATVRPYRTVETLDARFPVAAACALPGWSPPGGFPGTLLAGTEERAAERAVWMPAGHGLVALEEGPRPQVSARQRVTVEPAAQPVLVARRP